MGDRKENEIEREKDTGIVIYWTRNTTAARNVNRAVTHDETHNMEHKIILRHTTMQHGTIRRNTTQHTCKATD